MPNEPGKCYAKSIMPPLGSERSITLPMFTGVDSSVVNFTDTTIVLSKHSTKWVKKRADRNCLSANPDDCMVWCLVEVPREEVKFRYLSDTVGVHEYEMRQFDLSKEELTEISEWTEVLCDKDVSIRILDEVKLVLGSYFNQDLELGTRILDAKSNRLLSRYQVKHRLPKGPLNIETLEFMKIDY